jgi:hypothetical protein
MNNEPHGFGLEETVGYSYQGYFLNGKREGHGIMRFSNKDKFVGNFKDSHFCGYGVYRWADTSEYRGNFKNSKFDGIGTLAIVSENSGTKTELKAIWRLGTIYQPDNEIPGSQNWEINVTEQNPSDKR